MSFTRAEFVTLDKKQVVFSNRLLTHALHLVFNAECESMSVSNLQLAFNLPESVLLLKLQVGIHRFYCAIALENASQFLARYLEGVDFFSISPLLIEAALEKRLFGFQASLKSIFGNGVDLLQVSIKEGREVLKSKLFMSKATLAINDLDFPAYFLTEQVKLTQFHHQYARLEKSVSVDPLMKIQLRFGCTYLSPQQLSELALGDIMFFDQCYFCDERQLHMIVEGKWQWLVQLNNESVHIIKPWGQVMNNEEVNDYESGLPSNEDASAIDPMQIEMPVHFEMPSKYLPLSEVQALTEGYVFDLQADANSAIHIKVNGQKIASGELVKVGEKLGVRVTGLNKGE